jgi:membrane-associated phospholipid phosphatase
MTTPRLHRAALTAYAITVVAFLARLAIVDDWDATRWVVLFAFIATAGADRVLDPSPRSLALGVAFFGALTFIVAYVPNWWFAIAFQLHHAKHYLWNANHAMRLIPFNDGGFLWRHQWEPFSRIVRWIYVNGFDMVVWIPVVRSLAAFDARKVARYALGAHLLQFPLIMPFYTAFRVDEVWIVLGDPDRCLRGWTLEQTHSIGANCFPSMHTSVSFAVLLMARSEKSRVFSIAMAAYAVSIVFSTVYMEIHWLVDIVGGLLLGVVSVRLADWMLNRAAPLEGERAAPPLIV